MDEGTEDPTTATETQQLCPRETSPTNQADLIYLKVLVPSIAAGAIIGKGGEAIAQIQNETGAKIKLSKLNDFYPGTTERVCLIQGTLEGVRAMHNYVIDRILEKPEVSVGAAAVAGGIPPPPPPPAAAVTGGPQFPGVGDPSAAAAAAAATAPPPIGQHAGAILVPRASVGLPSAALINALSASLAGQASPVNRLLWERHKQAKILVPNCTAGLVIGKLGSYVNEIKERTGAFIQISQKPKDINLIERCITIAGEPDQLRAAVDMVLAKIAEDPQSGTCPNISYSHIQGPVASAFPTGSPFAFNPQHIPSMGAAPALRPADRAAVAAAAAGSGHQLLLQAAHFAAATRGAYPQAAAQGRQPGHQAFRWDNSLKSPTAATVDPAAFLRGYTSPTSPGDTAPCFYRSAAGQNALTAADLSPTAAYAAYAPMMPDSQPAPAPPPQSFFSAAAAVAAATNQLIMQAAAMRNSGSAAGLKEQQPLVYDLSAAPRFAYYSPTGTYASPPTGDATRICGSLGSPDTGFGGSASSPPLTQATQLQQQAYAQPQQQQPFYAAMPQQLFPARNVTPTSPPAGSATTIPITRQQNQTAAYADGPLLGCYPTAVGGFDFFGLFPGGLQSPTQPTYLPAAAAAAPPPPTLATVAAATASEQPVAAGRQVGVAPPTTSGEHLHASLRQSGFSEEVATEISGALSTLSIHGILSIGNGGGGGGGGSSGGSGAGGDTPQKQPQKQPQQQQQPQSSEVTSAVTTTPSASADVGSVGE